jgi:hypothetical protein
VDKGRHLDELEISQEATKKLSWKLDVKYNHLEKGIHRIEPKIPFSNIAKI